MDEAHKSRFSIHLGATKIYRDIHPDYWWSCMKWDVAWYVERCLTCRKVKVEHQRPHDKTHPLDIPYPVEINRNGRSSNQICSAVSG